MAQIKTTTDAVVIGSGACGLAAALTMAEGGAKVTVFEKQRSLGGTSNFFHGTFAVESELQREKYIAYTRDQAFKNIMEYSHWRANPRLVRAIVDESAATISWLGEQGVEFAGATTNMPGMPATYHVVIGTGEAVIKQLVVKAKQLGVTILPTTPVKRILKEDGRIAGVIAEVNEEEEAIGSKVVIIASGGYANNKEMIKKYSGYYLDVDVHAFGNTGKMGDGIRMALELGAGDEGLGVLELLRTGILEMGKGGHLGLTAVQPDLWVNSQGERFCDEVVTFYDTTMGNASVRQKNVTYTIFDSSIKQTLIEKGIEKAMIPAFPPGSRLSDLDREMEEAFKNNDPNIVQADSIEELAGKIGIEPAVLRATVDEYNGFCEKGHDDLFAKEPRYLRPIRGPKFYAIKSQTVFLGTLGGIKINHRMEVIDKKGDVIPGLYAGGYDAGGMYGDSYSIQYSSGLSSAFATNSGRIAGRNALKFIGK